jgi:uncharacterized protein YecE (DUF72 family)
LPSHGDIRIGISGWQYKPWRSVFYPKGLAHKRELSFAANAFRSIEINGTFYSLKRPENFARWAAETPDDFVFAIKGARYITHMLRLKNAKSALANFFASGIFRLGKKLGPILWQLPANFRFDAARLEAFFRLLPRDTNQAATLARRHERWLKNRVELKTVKNRLLRHALEIRHPSFLTPQFLGLLREHNIALVCADTVEWPRLMDITADFVYCRLHGSEVLYASGYSEEDLRQWAWWIAAWSQGKELNSNDPGVKRISDQPAPKRHHRDVYVYFDNDAKVRAPFDARSLIAKVAALTQD